MAGNSSRSLPGAAATAFCTVSGTQATSTWTVKRRGASIRRVASNAEAALGKSPEANSWRAPASPPPAGGGEEGVDTGAGVGFTVGAGAGPGVAVGNAVGVVVGGVTGAIDAV